MFNTFASQSLIFQEKNEPFLLKTASNLTDEFLYENLNKKIKQIFHVKIVIQKAHVSNSMYLKKMVHIISF